MGDAMEIVAGGFVVVALLAALFVWAACAVGSRGE